MRTENLAVMLTDMKGFTAATSRQSREENARMLALQDELVLPVVRAFGGRRVKTMGDAFLVLFSSPTSFSPSSSFCLLSLPWLDSSRRAMC